MPGNNNNGTRRGGPGKGPGKKAANMMSRRYKEAEKKSAAIVDRAFRGNADLRIGVVDGKIDVGHVPVKMNDGTMVPRARIPGKIGLSKRQARAGGLLVIEKGKRVVLDGEDIVGVFDPEQDRKYRLLMRGNRSASPITFNAKKPYEHKGLAEALATRKAEHKAAKQKAKAEAAENAKKAAATVAKIEREMAEKAKPIAFQEITIPGQKKKKEVKFGFKPESP
jgi:hypothetical protein